MIKSGQGAVGGWELMTGKVQPRGHCPMSFSVEAVGLLLLRAHSPSVLISAALASYPAFVFILLLSYPSYMPSINISLTEAASRENKHEQRWEITLKIKENGKT